MLFKQARSHHYNIFPSHSKQKVLAVAQQALPDLPVTPLLLPHLLLWPSLTLLHYVGFFAGPGTHQAHSRLRSSHLLFSCLDILKTGPHSSLGSLRKWRLSHGDFLGHLFKIKNPIPPSPAIPISPLLHSLHEHLHHLIHDTYNFFIFIMCLSPLL